MLCWGHLVVLLACVNSLLALQCWTCDSKCGCRTPRLEECPATTQCYTLKSSTTGDIVRKGCARNHCLTVNQNENFCESCSNSECNSETSLVPMNSEYDDCQTHSRMEPQPYNAPNGIGQGTGYGGSNTGYNGGIGSGTGYNGGIGSGTGYNGPNYNNQGPQPRNDGSIGSGTGYNSPYNSGYNNPRPAVGSGTGGNYYPGPNVNEQPYPRYGSYNGIGQGVRPYNSAPKFAFQLLPLILCFLFAQAL